MPDSIDTSNDAFLKADPVADFGKETDPRLQIVNPSAVGGGLVGVNFHGDVIVTFQHKGEPYVAMRRVVENLGMSWGSQREKLAAATGKFQCADIGTVDAAGRMYPMLSMPVAKLPLWLAAINPNKISDPTKRAKVELYQAESAIALHDYWTKGVAIRGDMDGVVTSLDPAAMKALGGMVKGIVGKAITELLPQLVAASIADGHVGIARGLTAGEVLDEAGITNRKGLRGLARRVSDHLRRHCSKLGVAVPLKSLGASTAYVFDLQVVREWLLGGGKQTINRWIEERRGQGALKLVKTDG